METLDIWQRVARPCGTVRVPDLRKVGIRDEKHNIRDPLRLDQHQVDKRAMSAGMIGFLVGGSTGDDAVFRFKIFFFRREAGKRIGKSSLRGASVHHQH